MRVLSTITLLGGLAFGLLSIVSLAQDQQGKISPDKFYSADASLKPFTTTEARALFVKVAP